MDINVFDFVNQILLGNSKGNVIELTEANNELYNKFVINKALSYHRDCLSIANMLNLYPGIDNKWHFNFLLNSVRKYKRPFRPWIKSETTHKNNIIRKYFSLSKIEAMYIEDLISDEVILELEKQLDEGGIKNDKSNSSTR